MASGLPFEPVALKLTPKKARNKWEIAIVGVGGTGGYLIQSLMRLLRAYDFQGMLTLADGDEVEVKNLHRQNFILPDVGKKKVDVLARRYSNVYDIDIRTIGRYIESMGEMENLFAEWDGYSQKVLIGCVDNNRSRQLFHEYFQQTKDLIYIDAGNDGVLPVSDKVTEEDSNESGYSGQVVVGVKVKGKVVLPPVGVVYPNILEESEQDFFPSQACGHTVVSFPQRFQTNLMAANVIMGYLNTLIGEGMLVSHYTNFNARNQVMRPEYITREMLTKTKRKAA